MQQREQPANSRLMPRTPAFQEPLLTYDPQTGRWFGANAQFSVWMDDATFQAYAAVWYQETTWLADRPLHERQAAARAYCRRLSYWQGCERNYDRRVHLSYH